MERESRRRGRRSERKSVVGGISAEESAEAGLFEMVIVGEGVGKAPRIHDFKGDAICEAPVLVAMLREKRVSAVEPFRACRYEEDIAARPNILKMASAYFLTRASQIPSAISKRTNSEVTNGPRSACCQANARLLRSSLLKASAMKKEVSIKIGFIALGGPLRNGDVAPQNQAEGPLRPRCLQWHPDRWALIHARW